MLLKLRPQSAIPEFNTVLLWGTQICLRRVRQKTLNTLVV